MRLTIDRKVALFISSLIFALGVILGAYFVLTQTRATNRELDERAMFLLEHLASDMEYAVLVRDREAISRWGKEAMRWKDVVYLRVEGKDGTLLFQAGQKGPGPVREFSTPVVFRKPEETAERLVLDVPKKETEKIGKVFFSISLSGLKVKISGIITAITGVVFAGIVLASLGAFLLLKRLVGKPIEQLVRATERVSKGDLAHEIDVRGQDEFGTLANSFNSMTDSLRKAQEELVHSEKLTMLGLIAGGMGNELRNPLGVMSNAVFFLKSVMLDADETVREYLDIIKSEIDNSHEIISCLLGFYTMKAPKTKAVPVHDLINQSLKRCTIPENIQVRTDMPEPLPVIYVDLAHMVRVLQNLITNAAQAMPNGGTLRIAACHRVQGSRFKVRGSENNIEHGTLNIEPDADFIEISVSDTGVGIAHENMGKLFQPLFTTRSRGIGLGLALSKKLTEANGGRIEVESEVGKGTTFGVTLPVERGEA